MVAGGAPSPQQCGVRRGAGRGQASGGKAGAGTVETVQLAPNCNPNPAREGHAPSLQGQARVSPGQGAVSWGADQATARGLGLTRALELSGLRAAGPAAWPPTHSLRCRFSSSPGHPRNAGTPSPRLCRPSVAVPWDGLSCVTRRGRAGLARGGPVGRQTPLGCSRWPISTHGPPF